MIYRAHPGIIFTIYSVVTMFLLGVLCAVKEWPVIVENSIAFSFGAFLFWGIVYYHCQWIEKRMRKGG